MSLNTHYIYYSLGRHLSLATKFFIMLMDAQKVVPLYCQRQRYSKSNLVFHEKGAENEGQYSSLAF